MGSFQNILKDDLEHIYVHTKSIWGNFRNKHIFITGGTGFFGKWLLESFIYVNKLEQLNASITILTRDKQKFLQSFPRYKDQENVQLIEGDILTFDFPKQEYNFIIHAATDADAAFNQSNPLLMMDTITLGTRRLLEFAKCQNALESFLFVSSGAVYGKQPENVTHINEIDSFYIDINNPVSAYAEGKRIAELYCSTYFDKLKLPVKIARCFAFVGPYLPLNKHFAIGNFILNAIQGEDIVIKGDGTPHRSYLYAADLAIWLWTILIKGTNNQPYNVGSDEGYTIKEVAELISSIETGVNVKVIGKRSDQPLERYVPSIDLIKKKLSLKVYITLAKSIKKTIEFYENV